MGNLDEGRGFGIRYFLDLVAMRLGDVAVSQIIKACQICQRHQPGRQLQELVRTRMCTKRTFNGGTLEHWRCE